MENYWTRRARFSRRQVVGGAATGGVGLAGLALVGCGDDDDAKKTSTPQTGGTTTGGTTTGGSPSATATVAAQKGGTRKTQTANFPATLDVYATNDSTVRNLANTIYSQLWQVKGVENGPEYPSQDLLPDLAERWEVVDPTTVVAKLNPKAKWHAPINRPLVADDVVYSLNRLLGKVPGVAVSSIASQFSMLDSYTATDKQTVTFKLKSPNWLFVWRMADNYLMPIMPPETGTAFDPTKTMVGTGPWIVDNFDPPKGWTFKRNPEWHLGPDKPYPDKITNAVVQDPATVLNQFKSGNIDSVLVQPKDMKGVKDAISNAAFTNFLPPFYGYIGFSAKDPSAPWNKDVRVRYAMSMAVDRNAIFQALYPANQITEAGLPAPKVQWHGAMPAGLGPNWLDPQGSQIKSELKQYFVYDPEKAKALLAQAGYPDGISVDYHYTTFYGAAWQLHAELVPQMMAKANIKLNTKVDDFNSVYNPKTFLGDFDGIATLYQGFAIAEDYLLAMYDPASGRNQSKVNDKTITDATNKIVADFDAKSRQKQVLDLQQYMIEKMYYIGLLYNAGPNYTAFQPYVQGKDKSTARSGGAFNDALNLWLKA